MSNEKKYNFFEDVWEVVLLIPKGRATSYGAIAQYLGTKMSARMVGWAMNAAHSHAEIPAHRVVNRNGQLTGKIHFETPETMRLLLEAEGIQIKEDTIINWPIIFWDPNTELI